MMTKHRVGRVQLPWANLEPPIRSPDYYKNLDEKKRLGAASEIVKQRRGKSVDLGSVRLPHTTSCCRQHGCMLPYRAWLTWNKGRRYHQQKVDRETRLVCIPIQQQTRNRFGEAPARRRGCPGLHHHCGRGEEETPRAIRHRARNARDTAGHSREPFARRRDAKGHNTRLPRAASTDQG